MIGNPVSMPRVIHLVDRIPEGYQPFEEVEEQVRAQVAARKRTEALQALAAAGEPAWRVANLVLASGVA
mgnify:CR=1 FL=1